jgi:hypothetical protein
MFLIGPAIVQFVDGAVIGSSSKEVSLLACGREDDQQGVEEEQPRIRDMKKGVFRRDAGRAAVRDQNWRDRTSAVFAVSSS